MPQLLLFPSHPPAGREPPGLSPEQQAALIGRLLKGLSPQLACAAAGLDPAAFCRSADEDAGFRRRLRDVRELLSLNVAAAVYQAALKGTPAAQALGLRTFPPAAGPDSDSSTSDRDEPDALDAFPPDDLDRQLAAYRAADA